jgi:serine protease Do
MRLFPSTFARAVLFGAACTLAMPLGANLTVETAQARGAPDSFADLAEKLLPAVVNISSSQTVQSKAGAPNGPEMPLFPPGSPFEQFFKDFLNRNRPNGGRGDPQQPERRAQSLGSGFIVDASGLVVTNNHVIDGADQVTVTLQDKTVLKAEVVGRDESGDIAVLRVKSDRALPTVEFGDSNKARVGDWVLAIGNPFGLGGSVTAGIVSARGRDIRLGQYDDFIQTDAAINKGNSGGPLFDMDGAVIGINTAIYSQTGGSVGIGFSIPSNMAKTIVTQIRDFGKARRGWLGVKIQQVTPDLADSLGMKEASGAMIAGLIDGGPAEKSSIRNGDIVLKFDGQVVKEMHSLPRIVAESPVGKQVPVVVWRDGKEITVMATLAEKPDDATLAATDQPGGGKGGGEAVKPVEVSGLGIKVAPITQELRDKYQLTAEQKGVVITEVINGGSAAERNLKAGDVIVEVQQGEVTSPTDVQKRVDAAKKADRRFVLMLIQRQDGVQYIPLALSKDKGKPG